MTQHLTARLHSRLLWATDRVRRSSRGQDGQGTVEYVGLAMSIGVLLLAIGTYLGGKDHGIGAIVTNAIKSAIEQASGGGK